MRAQLKQSVDVALRILGDERFRLIVGLITVLSAVIAAYAALGATTIAADAFILESNEYQRRVADSRPFSSFRGITVELSDEQFDLIFQIENVGERAMTNVSTSTTVVLDKLNGFVPNPAFNRANPISPSATMRVISGFKPSNFSEFPPSIFVTFVSYDDPLTGGSHRDVYFHTWSGIKDGTYDTTTSDANSEDASRVLSYLTRRNALPPGW